METNTEKIISELAAPVPMKNIIAALCGFQAELKNPLKDTDNPFFKSKYADLAGVWESCRAGMAKYGLCLVQSPSTDGNRVTVTGTLYHISGESIATVLTAMAKDTLPQSIGSTITYLRRYQMSAILGVASEDDDGAAASGTVKLEKVKTLAQEKGPFSAGIPFAQHQAEEAAKSAAKDSAAGKIPPLNSLDAPPEGQQDLGTFKGFITSGKINKTGPLNPDTAVPQWVLYQIGVEGRKPLDTFSKSCYEAAARAKASKEPVFISCEPGKYGPVIVAIEFINGERSDSEEFANSMQG